MIKTRIGGLKLNAPAASSIWYTASSVISRGVGFLFTPIFTRLLSPTEYGVYSLYVSFMGIFTVLTTFEISTVMYRGLVRFSGREEDFTSGAVGAQIFLTVLSLVIYAPLSRLVNSFTGLNTTLTLLLMMQVFFNSLTGIYFARERYSYEYKRVTVVNVAIGLLTPFLSLFLIRIGYGGAPRITSALIISALFALPIIRNLFERCNRLFMKDGWIFLLRTTLPILPHYLAATVIAHADKLAVSKFLGTAAMGKYSVAYSVGVAISTVTTGLSLALSPWITRKLGEGRADIIKEAVTVAGGGVSVCVLFFLAFLPELFRLLVSSEYHGALPVIYPISVSVVFSFLSSALVSAILYYEKPGLITRNSLISATMAVISAIGLVWAFGYIGAGISTLISYTVSFFLSFFTSHRLAKRPLFDIKDGAFYFLRLFFFGSLLFFLQSYFLSRVILCVAIAVGALPLAKRCKRIIL